MKFSPIKQHNENYKDAKLGGDLYYKILATGSSGNCVVLNDVIIDTGAQLSMKYLEEEIDFHEISFLLYTHHHGDHFDFRKAKKISEKYPWIKILAPHTVSLFLKLSEIPHNEIMFNQFYENTKLGIEIKAIQLKHMNNFTFKKRDIDQDGFISKRCIKGAFEKPENKPIIARLKAILWNEKNRCETNAYDIRWVDKIGDVAIYEKKVFYGTDTNDYKHIDCPNRHYYFVEYNYRNEALEYSQEVMKLLHKIERIIGEETLTANHWGRTQYTHCAYEDANNWAVKMSGEDTQDIVGLHQSSTVISLENFKATPAFEKLKNLLNQYLAIDIEELDIYNTDLTDQLKQFKQDYRNSDQ